MAELFDIGKTYTFFFSREHGESSVTGQVLSFEAPLVKIETEGLVRLINCSSAYFLEAIARKEDEET